MKPKSDRLPPRWTPLLVVTSASILLGACAAGPAASGTTLGSSRLEGDRRQPPDLASGGSTTAVPGPCQALANYGADALRRWIAAYPVQRGGVVLVFTGNVARPQEIETALELYGIAGYERVTCGTAVVLWIPAFDCPGPEQQLAERIEGETTMNLSESHCFRVDEVQYRLTEDCEHGAFPVEYCR